MRYFYLSIVLFFFIQCKAQEKVTMSDAILTPSPVPYHQIPEYPANYKPGNVAARMIDGLGYRYYWATKDLRDEDLAYRPSEDAQNVTQTLVHLHGLSLTILNATKKMPNIRSTDSPDYTFDERRSATLKNFKAASDQLKGSSAKDLEAYKVIFQRDTKISEFPFWNLINGPITDAIYHTGQIVSFRRTTGNPIQGGVNVFSGKTKE